MLAIRLQRVGRKGLPIYRIAVQEAQRHPSSGRVVAYVGTYNPHTKDVNVNEEKVQTFLGNGAQPTPRVVKLLKGTKVKLPSWVETPVADKQKSIKNAEKLRKNQPKEEVESPVEDAPAEEKPASESEEAETKE
jgi:small subunit ribosomal protein S16